MNSIIRLSGCLELAASLHTDCTFVIMCEDIFGNPTFATAKKQHKESSHFRRIWRTFLIKILNGKNVAESETNEHSSGTPWFFYGYCQHPRILIIIKGHNRFLVYIFLRLALSFVCLFYFLWIYVHHELAIKLKAYKNDTEGRCQGAGSIEFLIISDTN